MDKKIDWFKIVTVSLLALVMISNVILSNKISSLNTDVDTLKVVTYAIDASSIEDKTDIIIANQKTLYDNQQILSDDLATHHDIILDSIK